MFRVAIRAILLVCLLVALASWLVVRRPAVRAAETSTQQATAAKAVPDHAIVPGFDRFFTADGADPVRGGLLLWSELGCAACHEAGQGVAGTPLPPKQAPLLGDVGARVNPKFLRAFIADPQATKPGTTMPALLAHLDAAQREAMVEPLVHFLVSLGGERFKLNAPDGEAVARGERLFHARGCVACHAPRRDGTDELDRQSVPLPKLEEKYSVASLTAFLLDPLKVRPSGRMPEMNLEPAEAHDLAHFLLKDTDVPNNLTYAYYEGTWPKLPDFDQLQPAADGATNGFGPGVRRRDSNFGLKLDGFFEVAKAGTYKFWLTSDDGSKLIIDGKTVVDNDGIHAPQTHDGQIELKPGVYPISVPYMQGGGEYVLRVEMEGPGIPKRQIPSSMLRSTREPPPAQKPFEVNPGLARQGRELFASLGCAACHQLGEGQPTIASQLAAPPLAQLKPAAGCLSTARPNRWPQYRLNEKQIAALAAAVTAMQPGNAPIQWTDKQRVVHTLATLNCYACHERDGVGGVVPERDAFFLCNEKDLGEEGRIPPRLTGVGDKLQDEWLAAVLYHKGIARPYMDTHMPQFGQANVGHLVALLVKEDHTAERAPPMDVPPAQAKEAGRALIGKGGLSCLACHVFNRHQSTGIQAMDLTRMPERLRRDWYYRYLINPQQFRPGTRMPQAWPNGVSFKPDILEGNVDRQILATWEYLADGRRAVPPEGLTRQTLELIVGGEAIVNRGFFEQAGPRAICVGYPDEVNLAFDAERMRLATIWQGRFVDASVHWTGRGQGFGKPLGTKVINLVAGAPFAVLPDAKASWPKETGKEAGYRFRGYRLDRLRRPTFLYEVQGVRIEDFSAGRVDGQQRSLVRTLTLTAPEPVAHLYFRAAAQAEIRQLEAGTFQVGDQLTIKLSGGKAQPLVRDQGGKELLLPIALEGNKATLVEEFTW